MNESEKFEILKNTRKNAQKAFLRVLEQTLSSTVKISEAKFRDLWHKELLKDKNIFPEGWYIPPPHGIGVLFATDKNPQRLEFRSLRDKTYWPKNDVYLDKDNGIIIAYSSPVDKKTGIIGDFGTTVYLGKNKNLIKHIKRTRSVLDKIFKLIQRNEALSEFYKKSEILFAKNNLVNHWWISINDPTGINMGHSIPGIREYDYKEKKILKTGDSEKIVNMISQKRIFVNSVENTIIKPPFALTIEPRLRDKKNSKLPPIFFHTIALFPSKGRKEHIKPY